MIYFIGHFSYSMFLFHLFKTLLFLDSHCEVTDGWLEPLLDVLHKDPHTVAVPLMDIINADSFFYETSSLVKGGFNWGLHYQWDPLSPEEASNVMETAEPYKYGHSTYVQETNF